MHYLYIKIIAIIKIMIVGCKNWLTQNIYRRFVNNRWIGGKIEELEGRDRRFI